MCETVDRDRSRVSTHLQSRIYTNRPVTMRHDRHEEGGYWILVHSWAVSFQHMCKLTYYFYSVRYNYIYIYIIVSIGYTSQCGTLHQIIKAPDVVHTHTPKYPPDDASTDATYQTTHITVFTFYFDAFNTRTHIIQPRTSARIHTFILFRYIHPSMHPSFRLVLVRTHPMLPYDSYRVRGSARPPLSDRRHRRL